ncbi:hypothetical protein TVAG_308880 [Trichomonas vaginalis G3]|uniref:Tubulin-tyrosine ligase family protein n=1 Tax=Trichomonas vaginalis (strain ATCC PRA-98 / G3) TaxID=412133 RepID=A2EDN4_TRIV3|nr:protein polyglutamylation [Trichomonas vaginalis G3]EAY09199.1 hypothetical protein TVAG_308880 [Trichomonas vaginalis G3]KAI5486769.1 protein polyglutamylation [Trichomonas vaginalis G3]|eukprot:XP_001321422.1 hypothetical protein [Trichomonas vaginalis G3]
MCIMASLEHFRQQNNHRLSFELFGFDVILSINGDVYILEANSSPELDLNSELDNSIKVPLVKDMLNLALIPQPSEKVDFIEEKMQNREDEQFCAAVCISEYEIAQRQCGRFRCIYPTVDRIIKLQKYMNCKEPEDLALEQWISYSREEQAAYISVLYEHFDHVLENANLKI